ncbi:MAG: cytochrome C [Acidobacteria bacterium]|nr:MAG: cytochrome C [Acidobacteriota bacterium]
MEAVTGHVSHGAMIRLRVLVVLALLAMAGVKAAGQAAPSPYAGSEACQTCHEDIFNAFAKNPHHLVETDARPGWKAGGWQGRACESCHGPAQKHTESASAEDIRNPAKLAAAAAGRVCLSCHLNQPTHAGRLESSHAKNDVSCTACHKVHGNGPSGLVARTASAINQQCSSCHTGVWAQFQRPSHHRLPEGAMSCVDCHNPHGSIRPAMTQAFGANEPGCLKCHGEKRGPFAFEHAPVRFEGCRSCHEPHGSANPRMLARQEVRNLCLECHANLPRVTNTNAALGVVPPAFHDLRSPRFRNCTVCHQKIHGSHVDRNLLR